MWVLKAHRVFSVLKLKLGENHVLYRHSVVAVLIFKVQLSKASRRLYLSCSAGNAGKLGHSQVRGHAVIGICSQMLLEKKTMCAQHNLYLNRYQDKWHCGWKAVFVLIFLLCCETKDNPEDESYKCYSCIICLTFPTFPNRFSRW